MRYYKDKHRIEDALIPHLFVRTIDAHVSHDGSKKESYEKALIILAEKVKKSLCGLSGAKRSSLIKRLERNTNVIWSYVLKENFDTRKCFIALRAWAEALHNTGTVPLINLNLEDLAADENYYILIGDIAGIVEEAYANPENVEQLDAIQDSALKHVKKIHKLAQTQLDLFLESRLYE